MYAGIIKFINKKEYYIKCATITKIQKKLKRKMWITHDVTSIN